MPQTPKPQPPHPQQPPPRTQRNKGTYVLTSVINFRKAIVLRGEGLGVTTLSFPKSLTDLYNNTWVEGKWKGTSQYSHGTGFINIGGWDPNGREYTRLTYVRKDAQQGERVLQVGSAAGVEVGSWVRLWMRDPGDGSLMRYLNPHMDNGAALKGACVCVCVLCAACTCLRARVVVGGGGVERRD